MFRTLTTAILSAMIGTATLAAIPATAQAEGLYLNLGRGQVGVFAGDDRGGYGREGWRDRGPGRGWDRDRGCSPDRALDKAERMGVRRARVIDVSRRTITVAGRQYGDRVRVTFARERHCPVL